MDRQAGRPADRQEIRADRQAMRKRAKQTRHAALGLSGPKRMPPPPYFSW